MSLIHLLKLQFVGGKINTPVGYPRHTILIDERGVHDSVKRVLLYSRSDLLGVERSLLEYSNTLFTAALSSF